MKNKKFSLLKHDKRKTPEIYTSVALSCDKNVDIAQIKTELKTIGVNDIRIVVPKCSNELNIIAFETRSKQDWCLNDVISSMFSTMDCCMNKFCEIITKYNGSIHISIAFWHYKTYPALEISKENIEKIHLLNASVGIDPY